MIIDEQLIRLYGMTENEAVEFALIENEFIIQETQKYKLINWYGFQVKFNKDEDLTFKNMINLIGKFIFTHKTVVPDNFAANLGKVNCILIEYKSEWEDINYLDKIG